MCENGILSTQLDQFPEMGSTVFKFSPQQTDRIKKELDREGEQNEELFDEVRLLKTLRSNNSKIVKHIRGGSKCSEVTWS